MRSTSRTIRSVSSQISRVSARSCRRQTGFEQLRGAANSRQRILDFVRQHRCEARNRAGGAAMRQLPVYFIGNCTFLQHNEHAAVAFGQRRAMNVDAPVASLTRSTEVDLVFVDRGAALAHLRRQARQAESRKAAAAQALSDQQRLADFEKDLGGGVGVDDDAISMRPRE